LLAQPTAMPVNSWLCNILTPALLLVSANIDAQDSTKIEKPSLVSTKVAAPPKIDGKLDDAAWQNAPIASGFITFLPEFGKSPSRNTEVKVVYDNTAIYIGAMMYDPDPSNINTQLSERDGGSNADNFLVGFDTYDDDLNGYRFTVSASGVQSDQRFGINSNGDMSWDAVWQSDVSITENGWIAEMKIPYSAIRFPSKPLQNWGLQFNRNINSTGELLIWSPVDPKIYGIINQWGSLTGLENIIPPLRLSLSPYLNAGFQWDPVSYDPVEYGRSEILNGGMDIKYGINESFTIDATLIPNFGEVQSDNVILNLSPFEQHFDERRPFFTEGTEIFNQTFNFISDNLFYSRRIGGLPYMYYDVYYNLGENERVIENPAETSLYNATKFSGRTDKNLGIGIFNAIAAEEYATIENIENGEKRSELTSPLTNYNMIVFEQSLKNNSKVSFTNTNTLREGIYRDANVSQGLFDITNKKHTWNWWGFGNYSQVFENTGGAETEPVDPKTGYSYIAGISTFIDKWNINFSHALTSPDYDHNDMGIQYGNNFTSNFLGFNYNNQEPKKGIFYNYNAWGNVSYNARVEPWHYEEMSTGIGFNGQFKNFWNAGANIFSKPFYYYDFYEPRFEGYKYYHHPYAFISVWGGTDYRKDFYYSLSMAGGESPYPKDPYVEMSHYLTWNMSDNMSLTYNLFMSKDRNNFGFVDYSFTDLDELTIYFGRRNITTVSQELSGKYIFGPKMNIIARARYYWGKVNYLQYYELEMDGGLDENTAFTGNYDINFNLFNVDFVYAWEFAPGSYLNVIWKNNIFQSDDIGTDNFFTNCRKTFETPQTNGVSLKVIYYLDYQYLKKKA